MKDDVNDKLVEGFGRRKALQGIICETRKLLLNRPKRHTAGHVGSKGD